ncbi:hypothetical protein QBC34DRAFT_492253 [Podospora aff. communis PSN243]|uniref:SRR1-like domain-containing protein n=1 Tax=Podospora aff. communis PSN243 TaxID=3040156 RepID=A0AAV9GWN6_9PEZI|nr:hypothetical protein QBC34DRAFT_492253 [Podospora aff. communis PSN243]
MGQKLIYKDCGCLDALDLQRVPPCDHKVLMAAISESPDNGPEDILHYGALVGYRGDRYRATAQEKAKTIEKVQQMEDADEPFFSRVVLQKVVDTFDNWHKMGPLPRDVPERTTESHLSLTGLTHWEVRFPNQIGETCCLDPRLDEALKNHGPGHEVYRATPLLHHRPYRDLIAPLSRCGCEFHTNPHPHDEDYHLDHPLAMHYISKIRHARTKVPLPDIDTLDLDPSAPRTAAQLHRKWMRSTRKWASKKKCWGRIKTALLPAVEAGAVTNIVGFALGGMLSIEQGEEDRFLQHRLVLLLGGLFSTSDKSVGMVVQDPSYTDVDRGALAKEGVKVVNDPRGFLEVDAGTVVVSMWATIPVLDVIADTTRGARPVAIITQRIATEGANQSYSRRAKKMMEEYDEVELRSGQVDGLVRLSDGARLMVHVRKGSKKTDTKVGEKGAEKEEKRCGNKGEKRSEKE